MVLSLHGSDITIVSALHGDHIILNMFHAKFFDTVALQKQAKLAGIEVIGVISDGSIFSMPDRFRRQTLLTNGFLIT